METIILIEGIRDTSDVIHDAGHARATYSQRYLFYLRDIGSPFAPISWSVQAILLMFEGVVKPFIRLGGVKI